MSFKAITFSLVTVLFFLLNGCSGGAQNPTNPDLPDLSTPLALSTIQDSSHQLLGYWEVTVDPEAATWEAVPVRVAGIHLNILKFLEEAPCTNCFQITSIEKLPNTDLDLIITITHPFNSSMVNLTVFDMRGILMFYGTEEFPELGIAASKSNTSGDSELINADGYTTLYNPLTEGNGVFGYLKGKMTGLLPNPTATLNAYKIYYTNANRLYFSAGSSDGANYILRIPDLSEFTFGYAVDCSWDIPTEPINVPDSFPDTANCWEAYHIETSLDHGLATADNHTAILTIDVYDWQGAASIETLQVEGPHFWTGLIAGTKVTGGPGDQRFEVELINEINFVTPGDYPILVRVLDTTSQPGALLDNTAWMLVDVPVYMNHVPVCSAIVSNPEPDPGETITFTDTSTDPEGPGDIVESWWDWDNNGTWDESGFEVEHTFSETKIEFINHMVKDSAGAEDTLGEPIELDIGLFITLSEDKDHKQPGTSYQFEALDANYDSGNVIDVDDPDGPWDFTTIGLNTQQNWRLIIDDGDPEVAGFVDDFNDATSHFVKLDNMFDPLFNYIYQAEYHHDASDTLYIYGFYEPDIIGSSAFGPPDTPNSLGIPYPLTIDTNYEFVINNPPFYLDYTVEAIGEGDVTVPYNSGTTYNCLLVRYRFSVVASPPLNGGYLNFAFINDDGLVVANVTAINTPPTYNWNTSTNLIYTNADVMFQALHDIP